MSANVTIFRTATSSPDSTGVPDGAPAWITVELIQKTIETWQPYYESRLLPEDALEILMGVGRMMEAISRDSRKNAGGCNRR
jgi:hypothetical protein